jgi:cytidylate kinase
VNIFISGLTASGKTTTARRVALALQWKLIEGSAIRAEVLGIDHTKAQACDFWRFAPNAAELDRGRITSTERDKQIDTRILSLAAACGTQVLDVWFVAWLAPPDTLTIWLETPLHTRAERLAASRAIPLEDAIAAIGRKDRAAAAYAAAAYGIDLLNDRSPFNLVINSQYLNAGLLPEAAIHQAAYRTWGDAVLRPPRRTDLSALKGPKWRGQAGSKEAEFD